MLAQLIQALYNIIDSFFIGNYSESGLTALSIIYPIPVSYTHLVCEYIAEEHMNEIISVNGSSPAYIYLFAKAMADYAQECCIDYDKAMNLICATLEGSAKTVSYTHLLTGFLNGLAELIRKEHDKKGYR